MSTATGPRILVVDDEPNIVEVVSMALRYQGFEVATAANGAEALAQVEAFRPQLLVLDVMLPDTTGFEIAERLGAQRSTIPIIFLTARDAQEDKLRGLTTGGDDYVTKPFSLEELVARIRTILRRTGQGAEESSRMVFEDLELDDDTHEVLRAGQAGRADRHRVPAAALLPFEPAPRPDPCADPRPRLGVRLRRRRPGARDLHLLPAQEARRAWPRAHPHRARGRLRAADAPVTLRLRLVLTLVALAAGGLLVLGAVTYVSQRSFQLDRIDEQTRAAEPALGFRLEAANGSPVDAGRRALPAPQDRDGDGRGGPDQRAANLPPGTYGARLDSMGKRVGDAVVISLGTEELSPPALPEDLADGQLRTVEAQDGSVKYRLRVSRPPGGSQLMLVAIPLSGVDDSLGRLLLVEGLVIVAVLLLLGGLAWVLVRAGLRPLDRMGLTAGAIVAGDLGRRVEDDDPRTEVGRLGGALNGMLGRLEDAFAAREASEQRLRQFLSDAAHELRTPLASVRGYAELFRMGALNDPDQAAGALGRIEDESARMGKLVENLLVLARLDELSEPVREPVDLGALAEDAVADARATAPERTIVAVLEDEVLAVGDADQLRQVLGNLLRNALVHTPADARIEVRVGALGERVRLEVRDDGPGLPPGDAARLFDRFWRAEGAGRERGRDGAGLGLAIVAGIVAAHDGTVRAMDVEGGGAAFVVELPGRTD